jgi:hypothetical protein
MANMSDLYNPRSWFWIVGGDETRAWSSAAGAYVTEWDAQRITRIANETELSDVLRSKGLTVPAPTQQDYAAAVQKHIDALAVSRGYADGVALAGYVASNVATWAYEAHAFIAWRDAVWDYVYAQLAAVQAGQRQQPTVQGLIGELPSVDWNPRPDDTLARAIDRIAELEAALGEFAQRLEPQP